MSDFSYVSVINFVPDRKKIYVQKKSKNETEMAKL